MTNIKIYLAVLTLAGGFLFASCAKDDDVCKVCHYTETDGSQVSLGELCGNEYKTVESSGFVSGTGQHDVTCQ